MPQPMLLVRKQHTADTCPGKPCSDVCDHVEHTFGSVVSLVLDVELMADEKQVLHMVIKDALSEFMANRNTEVSRAGTDNDAEYYTNYGSDAYVEKRYKWMNAQQKKEKAKQVRLRCRVAAILLHAAFGGLEVK